MADLRSTRTSIYLRNYALDTGSVLSRFPGAKIRVYTGAQPATPETAATGTLLVELTMGSPAFGAAASGVLTATAITPAMPTASGTPGWFRIVDSAAVNTLVDGEAGLSGDANTDNMELPAAIAVGVQVGISSYTFTLPMQGI